MQGKGNCSLPLHPIPKIRTKICQLCPRSKLSTLCPAGHTVGKARASEGRKKSLVTDPSAPGSVVNLTTSLEGRLRAPRLVRDTIGPAARQLKLPAIAIAKSFFQSAQYSGTSQHRIRNRRMHP